MSDEKFKIVECIGCISDPKKSWKTELNLVEWNGKEAKYDIRKWKGDHEMAGKGVTLSKDELIILRNLLNDEVEYLKRSEA